MAISGPMVGVILALCVDAFVILWLVETFYNGSDVRERRSIDSEERWDGGRQETWPREDEDAEIGAIMRLRGD